MSIATVGPAKPNDAGLTIGYGGKGEGERPQTCAAARLIGLMDPSGKRKLLCSPTETWDMEEQAAEHLFTRCATGKGRRIPGASLRTE